MAYDPEATASRPLLSRTRLCPYRPLNCVWRFPRTLFLLVTGALTLFVLTAISNPAAGVTMPDRLAGYYHEHLRPPPPPHKGLNLPPHQHEEPPHPHPPPINSAIDTLHASQPPTLSAARARYSLKTARPPPRGFDAFFDFATQRGCLVDAYYAVYADFAPFWRAELAMQERGWFRGRVRRVEEQIKGGTRGLTALTVHDGEVYLPNYQGTYFDRDWNTTIGKFSASLPAMTILVNGRDEPRVVFDVLPLLEDSTNITHAVALTDPAPFSLSPPSTASFFGSRAGCAPRRGTGVWDDISFLLSPSSAEFTTDLFPVLSMAKIADIEGSTCFADILVPGQFYYRSSAEWSGSFGYPDTVAWADKKDVLYWRGRSNGGHIRGTNYRSFPRFWLLYLATRPENQGLFDVRISTWHESHCTDDCNAHAIKHAYNITGQEVPREEAYGYKYLLDIDGNTFSGRYLNLLRSGGLVFKSTAFAEFFTPWLVPFEHFIPVRPDLADLPAKIEWARANDAEARRIQEAGRLFAERVFTDAQSDCYWFAVLLEWGALWGED